MQHKHEWSLESVLYIESYHEGVEEASSDGVYGEATNYEVPMSSKTDSKVWLCEEEYSTLKH